LAFYSGRAELELVAARCIVYAAERAGVVGPLVYDAYIRSFDDCVCGVAFLWCAEVRVLELAAVGF